MCLCMFPILTDGFSFTVAPILCLTVTNEMVKKTKQICAVY